VVLRAFVAAYPYAQAAIQAVQFAYHLGYLLGINPEAPHGPMLHLLGVEMARVSAEDMVRKLRQWCRLRTW
jgi:hypothetical protein